MKLYPVGTEFEYVYAPDIKVTDYFKSTHCSVFRYCVTKHEKTVTGEVLMALETTGHRFDDPGMKEGIIIGSVVLPDKEVKNGRREVD